MERQADKQQPIKMGKVIKILRPNFDDHITEFPRIDGTGRGEYLGSEERHKHDGYYYSKDKYINPAHYNSQIDLIPKSAGIKTAIQELKETFCKSFKRK